VVVDVYSKDVQNKAAQCICTVKTQNLLQFKNNFAQPNCICTHSLLLNCFTLWFNFTHASSVLKLCFVHWWSFVMLGNISWHSAVSSAYVYMQLCTAQLLYQNCKFHYKKSLLLHLVIREVAYPLAILRHPSEAAIYLISYQKYIRVVSNPM